MAVVRKVCFASLLMTVDGGRAFCKEHGGSGRIYFTTKSNTSAAGCLDAFVDHSGRWESEVVHFSPSRDHAVASTAARVLCQRTFGRYHASCSQQPSLYGTEPLEAVGRLSLHTQEFRDPQHRGCTRCPRVTHPPRPHAKSPPLLTYFRPIPDPSWQGLGAPCHPRCFGGHQQGAPKG